LENRDILLRILHSGLHPKTFHISHNADYSRLTFTIISAKGAFPDWIFSGEFAMRPGFVDDNNGRRIFVILLGEASTRAQLYAHCAKVISADFKAASLTPDFTRTVAGLPHIVQWKLPDRRNLHTGQGVDAREQVLVEEPLLRRSISRSVNRYLHCQHVLGAVARVHCSHL